MATSSPSEFLTFFKRASTSTAQALRHQTLQRTSTRPFTSSIRQLAGAKEKEVHTLENGPNPHSQNSKEGEQARAQDTGGVATEQKDSKAATKKAKEDFPEAPDTIGFQDERGGKGH